ncbi:MAG TPA: LamG domain-containing protein, partial [Ktedonobacteraceae bacterium]|nr:LamG domain-containing protein [Ktedonobacteraceae bacterium]
VTGLRVIFAKPLGTGTSLSYALWLSSETLRGAISDAVSGGPELAAPFSPIPGHWYHVAYTFDDSTHQQALYVDGIQIAIGLVTKSISYDTRPLLLGRDTNSFLGGSIDEASIYDRALTDLEIASIYEAGPAGKRL